MSPAVWRRGRLKHLCQDAGQYGLNISAEGYTAAGLRLVRTSDIAESGTLKPPDRAVYVDVEVQDRHLLEAGDVLLSRSGTLGRSLLVPEAATGSTYAGYLVRFRPRDDVDPRFLAYVTTSTPFLDTVRSEAVSSTIQNFNAERYANVGVPIPPLAEQRRIADFLDGVSARIARASELRIQQVEAVRKRFVCLLVGMLLPSDDKAGWQATKLKHLFEFERAGVWGDDPNGSAEDVVCVRVADFDRDRFVVGEGASTYRSVQPSQLVARVLRHGDVLLEKSGGGEQHPVGFAVSYTGARDGCPQRAVCSNFVALLRPRRVHDPRFAALLMAAAYHAGRNVPFVKQTTGIQNLDSSGYLSQQVAVPQLRRQREIAIDIDDHNDSCQTLIDLQRQHLSLLAERRDALVTAAVAGTFDVATASGTSSLGAQ